MSEGIRLILIVLVFLSFSKCALAEEANATVTTESGNYSVPVEVEDGEVTEVHWPNGGDMNISGAEISDGEASGTNSQGESIGISLDNYEDPDMEEDEAEAEEEEEEEEEE